MDDLLQWLTPVRVFSELINTSRAGQEALLVQMWPSGRHLVITGLVSFQSLSRLQFKSDYNIQRVVRGIRGNLCLIVTTKTCISSAYILDCLVLCAFKKEKKTHHVLSSIFSFATTSARSSALSDDHPADLMSEPQKRGSFFLLI